MNRFSLSALLVIASALFLLASCGTEGDTTTPTAPQRSVEKEKKSDDAVRVCSVTGDIKDFTIDCTKDIESFTYEFFTSGNSISIKMNLNGRDENLKVFRVSASQLKGYDRNKKSLLLTLSHTDGSKSKVRI